EAALSAYKEVVDNFKILVLFTDGEDHDSGALGAAEKAAKAGLRIFTVGVGTPNGELLRVTDESGAASYIKDEQGTVVKSRLNETLLQQIASATGGFYLPLRGANAVETLYESARYKEAQHEYDRLLQKEGDEKAPDFKAAQEKNEAGKDQEAWKEVTRSLADARVGDPRLHFNAGTAAYKAGDLENAAKH